MPTLSPRKNKASKLTRLLKFDADIRQGWERPYAHLIGLDEVGRGSMIGPIVAGAACLPESLDKEQKRLLHWLDDSKKLSREVRGELCGAIQSFCQVALGIAEKEEVDRLNVHHASLLALYRAFENLCDSSIPYNTCYLLVDGRALLGGFPKIQQQAVIKGDGHSAAIAAASIVAKEARDNMIIALAQQYPGYGWERNMGYGTPEHLHGLKTRGVTPLHRQNYKPVSEQLGLALLP